MSCRHVKDKDVLNYTCNCLSYCITAHKMSYGHVQEYSVFEHVVSSFEFDCNVIILICFLI